MQSRRIFRLGRRGQYFGFYATTKKARVTKVTVTITGESGGGQGFAIGEFGIH
jgi:hypothetical protein